MTLQLPTCIGARSPILPLLPPFFLARLFRVGAIPRALLGRLGRWAVSVVPTTRIVANFALPRALLGRLGRWAICVVPTTRIVANFALQAAGILVCRDRPAFFSSHMIVGAGAAFVAAFVAAAAAAGLFRALALAAGLQDPERYTYR